MGLLDTSIFEHKVFTGQWNDGGGDPLPVRNPANDELLTTLGTVTPDQVHDAAERAAAAQRQWAQIPPSERAAVLRRAGQIIEDNAEEISDWIVRETGGITPKAGLEVHNGAAECFEAAALPTHPQGQWLSSDSPHWSLARRRPAGVVTVISPFNFPLILSIRSVAPALALGNSVLLKPDPRTTVTGGFLLARVFEEAGLPEGVLQVLPGGGDVGAAAVAAEAVRIISFTGSTAAGRIVGAEGAKHLKRTHLELGGNNAVVVLPGADLDLAASAGAMGSFFHQGQICMTTGRHVVHQDVYDDYVAKLSERAENLVVGDPSAGPVHLGPIIDEKQLKNVDSIVQETVMAGGSVRAGATHDGLFYRPTVLTDLSPDMPAWKDEIFGPVAPVLAVGSVDEAVEMVNASDYGLSVSVIGPVGEAMKVADRVHSGKVHINEMTVADQAQAPFGGVGASGTGSRFGGAEANIEAFTETQWVTVAAEIPQYPF
ncbi:aldehyde dehydrogenase family protein [Kocuria sp.]|uniref:aldehyde dehydrogenase family protein n=1 Tax=Kocuria sp. TaxID=1871328 RepID=UPI0026E081F5|nr:aldehyde dehydrogenase family protein [Kocuria sp.]MDO5618169.1 aldehyde dehydrogenase family protein [Kocuria sp.]